MDSKQKDNNSTAEFSSRLKELINEKGLSLRDLAADMGVTFTALSDWQRGNKTPRADSIVILARYFGVSSDYLLGLTNVRTSETDIRSVAEYTGLSEDAVKELHHPYYRDDPLFHNAGHNVFIMDEDSPRIDDYEMWMISQLIEMGYLYTIASLLSEIWNSTIEKTNHFIRIKKRLESERFNDSVYEDLFYYHNPSITDEELSKNPSVFKRFKDEIDNLPLDELARLYLSLDYPDEVNGTDLNQFRIQKVMQEFIDQQIILAEGYAEEKQNGSNHKTD